MHRMLSKTFCVKSQKIPGAKIARNALLDLSQVFLWELWGVWVARNGGNSCKLCSNVGLVKVGELVDSLSHFCCTQIFWTLDPYRLKTWLTWKRIISNHFRMTGNRRWGVIQNGRGITIFWHPKSAFGIILSSKLTYFGWKSSLFPTKEMHSLKLTVRTWKWMVGRRFFDDTFLLGFSLFSGAFAVSFKECTSTKWKMDPDWRCISY